MKKLSIAFALALSVVGCNVQTVDMQQPISAADKFYGTLKSGKASTAMTFFAPSFKNTVSSWPKFLGDLQSSFGPVTATELLEASLSTNDNSPCYGLDYAVQRGAHATEDVSYTHLDVYKRQTSHVLCGKTWKRREREYAVFWVG